MTRVHFSLSVLSGIVGCVISFGAVAAELADYKRPLTIPFEGAARYSPQLATLGKMLFFDPRLSGAKNMNCASCHNPSFGYEAPVAGSVGAANTPLARNSPTVLNMAWVSPHFWDGRAPTLEAQAEGPITAAAEMNGDFHTIVGDLGDVADYVRWFEQVFPGEGITKANVLTAIATYERTIVTGWSPFDRWVDGDATAVSDSAKRGFGLFTGKAGCSGCHTGWNFTDNKFHDIGLATEDIGRAKLEPDNPLALHAFKTPGLRNTAYRAPFMHNGSLQTLEEVVIHYESGGLDRPSRSPLMRPFSLTDAERADLVAFMHSMTADQQEASLPTLPN
ncbi:cytochrome-c peroxidase [Jiella sonneratiae]|uniref:C-type cytochrome n=1 Tax=Jiella sonneratiae TaxID=2816856 RepID=A0ABS3J4J6_9HYPH|nr:cytochrome c peroxidase [Jiella sonneratiae]MBO0904045.1 c-type cytochrome [Jiella sonneratiae]